MLNCDFLPVFYPSLYPTGLYKPGVIKPQEKILGGLQGVPAPVEIIPIVCPMLGLLHGQERVNFIVLGCPCPAPEEFCLGQEEAPGWAGVVQPILDASRALEQHHSS